MKSNEFCCIKCIKEDDKKEVSFLHRASQIFKNAISIYSENAEKEISKPVEGKSSQQKISDFCDNLKKFLVEKNRLYGNSALNPIRIFSKASPNDQILVRIDDKINRIMNMKENNGKMKDTIIDLMGYLVLLVINNNWDDSILDGLKDN